MTPHPLAYVDAFHGTVGLASAARPDVVDASCQDLTSLGIAIFKLRERMGESALLIFDSLTSPYMFNGAEVLLKPTIFPPYPQHMANEPYDWYTIVNKMRSIENMVYGINANGAKYGNSMIVDYLGRTIAKASKHVQMTIGTTIDVQALRDYRQKAKLHNMVEQVRTECYTYLNEPMWPKHKSLINANDYAEWVNKPKFYKK